MLTIQEAAKQLKVHPQTLYRWTREMPDKLKVTRFGGAVRIDEKDLQHFIDSCKDKTNSF
ncbi:MAG: helix-turn-helix domain-containing protein [Patescibacteria group bacterium]